MALISMNQLSPDKPRIYQNPPFQEEQGKL